MGLNVIYTNADQLINKRDELSMFIAGREPDIICVTEVIPKAQVQPIAPAQLLINGYNMYVNFDFSRSKLGASGRRGICIYVAARLQAREMAFPDNGFNEQLWVRIKLCGDDSLVIGGIYRSPSSEAHQTVELCNLLTDITRQNPSHLLIMGDFNFCEIDWRCGLSTAPPGHPSHQFLEATQDAYLIQHIREPTRFRIGNIPHTLDLVFSNEEGMVSNVSYHPGLGKSDHVVIKFRLNCYSPSTESRGIKYNLDRGNYEQMAEKIREIRWEETERLDLKNHYLFFVSNLKQVMDDFIPKLRARRKKKNIYMTRFAMSLRKKKSKLWKIYMRTQDALDHARFVRVRNDLRSLTRKLRRKYEQELVRKLKQNPKCFWQYVNTRLKTRSGVEDLEKPDGTLASSNLEKANVLANFFASVFTDEDQSEVPGLDVEWQGPVLDNFEFTSEMVERKLLDLRTSSSPGPDGVHPRVLKELAAPLSSPIRELFKKSLEEGQVPEDWKQGEVVPIHKGGRKQDPSNYRPVSLTSVLSKVMESIIRDRLVEHLKESEKLTDAQHGFLAKRSCATQLLTCLEDWTRHLEEGNPVDVAYLDFRKAFDSVPHRRLLRKLYDLGIRGDTLRWIGAFLTGRKLQVVVNGARSAAISVKSGIPQGSVLGPTLFIAYVNDLPEAVHCPVKLFADDAKLYTSVEGAHSQIQMQEDLDALGEWSRKWLLPFNLAKCKTLHMGHGNTQHQYRILDSPLCQVSVEKDLGIFIDDKLKFRKQAAAASNKGNQVLGVIRKSFEHLDKKTVPLLFKTLVRPILEFGNVAWGPFYKQDQRLIERVQRRATKLVQEIKDLTYEERLQALQLHSLHYRRRRGDMILVYMLMNGSVDLRKEDFFRTPPVGTTRGHPMKVAKPRATSRPRRNNWSTRTVNDWNSLPVHVIQATSLNQFKNRLDEFWADHVHDIP